MKAALQLGREVGQLGVRPLPGHTVGESPAGQLGGGVVSGEPGQDRPGFGDLGAQCGGETAGGVGPALESGKGPARDDPAPAHDGDPVSQQLGLAEDVGRDDHGGAAVTLLAQVAAHVGGCDRVKADRRLVTEEPARAVQGRSDQRHLLGHAAGVGAEDPAAGLGEIEALEQGTDPGLPLRRRNSVDPAVVLEVLPGGVAAVKASKVRDDAQPAAHGVEVAGQPEIVERDQALVGPQDAAQAAQRGRLPGAVLTEEEKHLARRDLEIHAGHRLDAAEPLPEAADRDHVGHRSDHDAR